MTIKFNDNFVYPVPEEEKEAIMKLDSIDDTIWEVLKRLDEHFEIGVDYSKIEHCHLSLEAREALMDVLKSFK